MNFLARHSKEISIYRTFNGEKRDERDVQNEWRGYRRLLLNNEGFHFDSQTGRVAFRFLNRI